jgi:hypothetical protein
MKKNMHENSLDALAEISDDMSDRAEMIYTLLARTGAEMTDRGLMQCLGFTERNATAPRITELIDNRWLVETSSVECPVTGKRVRQVRALSASERADLIERQRARFRQQRAAMVQPEFSFA